MDRPDGAPRPTTPPPRPLAPPAARTVRGEAGAGTIVGPAIAQRFGPVLLACAVTALVTWWAARRTR